MENWDEKPRPKPVAKVLSIRQPWASLIAAGLKTVETRSWPTRWRGALVIQAGRSRTFQERKLCALELREHLERAELPKFDELPRGCVVAVCRIVDCLETSEAAQLPALEAELALGDYSTGRHAWMLGQVLPMPHERMPLPGQLGLWQAPVDIEREALEALKTGRAPKQKRNE